MDVSSCCDTGSEEFGKTFARLTCEEKHIPQSHQKNSAHILSSCLC